MLRFVIMTLYFGAKKILIYFHRAWEWAKCGFFFVKMSMEKRFNTGSLQSEWKSGFFPYLVLLLACCCLSPQRKLSAVWISCVSGQIGIRLCFSNESAETWTELNWTDVISVRARASGGLCPCDVISSSCGRSMNEAAFMYLYSPRIIPI